MSIFTSIIRREAPGWLVWDDGAVAAFLDTRPHVPGHTLVVPYREVDQWTDLTEAEISDLFRIAHLIARAQISAFECARVGVVVAGFNVAHVHVHVFPTTGMEQFDFRELPELASDQDLRGSLLTLRRALVDLSGADPLGTAEL